MPLVQREMLGALHVCGDDSEDKVLAVHMGEWEMDAQGPLEA